MKSLILSLLVSFSLLPAQSAKVDSVTTSGSEVNIHDLVKRQIEEAKLKQSAAPVQTLTTIKSEPEHIIKKSANNPAAAFYSSLPLQYQLFISATFLVLIALVFRRAILAFKQRATKVLKHKIAMLREEKVVARVDTKLNEVRKKLRNGKSIFDVSEKQISSLAKELKIAKGELLLASRLKLFEIGKM